MAAEAENKRSMAVRILVPRASNHGIEFHVETRHIRLPLMRHDRELLRARFLEV